MMAAEQVDEREPIITEGHRLWPAFQAGLCCEYMSYGCRAAGRRCLAHGGCCNWPGVAHWPASEQSRLAPGVKLAIDLDGGLELTVVEIGTDPLGERAVICRLAGLPEASWEISFRACGAAHYRAWRGQGGGGGGLRSLRIVAEQGSLL